MPHPSRLPVVLALTLLSATAVQAQSARVAPSTSVKPSAATLSSRAIPNPSGLSSPFPAGINSGSGAAVANDRIGASTAAMGAGTTNLGTPNLGTTGGIDANADAAAAATTTLGAGAGSPGPSQYLGSGGSGLNAVDVARSFINADINRDGELTRGEASRLTITMATFEQMDRNFDGIISRSEYDDSLR